MSSRIFVSYRRQESAGHAARLVERLQGDYHYETVFFDQTAIPLGASFPEVLKTAVTESEIVLAVIGSKWLSCEKAPGKRRLDDSKDWVREELRRALKLRSDGHPRLLVPVLVEGASMPKETDLPNVLKPIAKCQAIAFGQMWDEPYRALLSQMDERLQISPEERAGDWIYDDIANRLEGLSEQQRRRVASKLSSLDSGGAGSAFSARALAKRFYKVGPSALESLRQALPFDQSLRTVLERLKDYWVTIEAANEVAQTWANREPSRATIVKGEESCFTPNCVVQKASNEMTPWRMKQIVSHASQPSAATVISDIHEWLRTVFANLLSRRQLPDCEEERVTVFLEECLAEKARTGQPVAVQLDETGATDEPLIRSIQTTFPHLRLLILVSGENGVRDMEQRYFNDVESRATTVVNPEANPGDEQKAADAYYKMADNFPLP